MTLHDANRALDGYFGGEDGVSPIQFVERRRTCRSCGQSHDLPLYAEPVDESASMWAFGFALLVALAFFAAVIVGIAVAA